MSEMMLSWPTLPEQRGNFYKMKKDEGKDCCFSKNGTSILILFMAITWQHEYSDSNSITQLLSVPVPVGKSQDFGHCPTDTWQGGNAGSVLAPSTTVMLTLTTGQSDFLSNSHNILLVSRGRAAAWEHVLREVPNKHQYCAIELSFQHFSVSTQGQNAKV